VEQVLLPLLAGDYEVFPVYVLRLVCLADLNGVAANFHKVFVFSVFAEKIASHGLLVKGHDRFANEIQLLLLIFVLLAIANYASIYLISFVPHLFVHTLIKMWKHLLLVISSLIFNIAPIAVQYLMPEFVKVFKDCQIVAQIDVIDELVPFKLYIGF
jgi:hypothetical protein